MIYIDKLYSSKQYEPFNVAVVNPTDNMSLISAVEAAKQKLINPILFGNTEKIHYIANLANLDITAYQIIHTGTALEAVDVAVKSCRERKTQALMKGNIHTDELMHAVVNKETGLRTKRRISHVFAVEIKTYKKMLYISDSAININPDLATKFHITNNAIDLAKQLGVDKPKVAILSAVETPTDRIPSSLDAHALSHMPELLDKAIIEGPLAFDNAISAESAQIKGINSQVAGNCDILIVPSIETGNILTKSLVYLGQANVAGIVLGAQVPIILTSRADNIQARITSCALATLLQNI